MPNSKSHSDKTSVVEVALAVVSFIAICLIYFVWMPGRYDPSSSMFRPLIYVVFAVLLPIKLFGVRDYAERYGFRRAGLAESAIISAVLALPLFALGYKLAAGPVAPLMAWYVLNALEETYFRGLWQRAGEHLAGPLGAIFIPALLFGFYHLTVGFTAIQALGPFLLGLLFGWLRLHTGNLLGPILLHIAVVTGMWFAPR